MQDKYNNQDSELSDNLIPLRELLDTLLQGKWIIAAVTAFASVVVVLYSLSLPNIYHSKSLLFPVEASSGISGALKNYSGLANLAGLSLPTQGGDSNSLKAMEKLKSLSFFEKNILPNIFLPELIAVKSWNSKTNTLEFREDIYNKNSNTWVIDSSAQKQIPTAQDSFQVFKKHLSLSEDNLSGFVSLTIKHQSPFIAKQWAELLINQINIFYRQKDKLQAEKSINYLNIQIAKTSFTEIKQVMAELVQQETQKLTLIESNESYVFDYIDPPAVMEKKSEPKRALICILGSLLGFIFGVLIVLIKHFRFKIKNS